MIKVPESSLIELEEELNKVTFNDIPLGGTIVSSLIIQLQNGNGDWSWKQRILDIIRYFSFLYRGIPLTKNKKKKYHKFPDGFKNKGLLTFISSRRHLFKMNYTVWKNFKAEETLCFLKDNSILSGFNKEEKPLYLTKNDLPSIDLKSWMRSFRKINVQTRRIIKSFLQQNNLPVYVGRRIINILLVQTQYLVAFDLLLKKLQPNFILVEHDRYNWCSCMILVGKKLNIPTFTLMHGVVNNRFGYLPMIADFLFCWGKQQQKLLENNDANPLRLVISGATQLDPKINASKEYVRHKLRIADNKKVILLATNPVGTLERHKLVQVFCETISQNENTLGIIRLHPSEDIAFYSKYIEKNPQIILDKNELISFEESFAVADIICIYNSAYGLDAALKGLPVLIININSKYLGQSKDFIDNGSFLVATNAKELNKILISYMNSFDFRQKLEKKSKKYAQQYCEAFGDEASNNIIGFIKSKIKSGGQIIEPKVDMNHVK